MTRPCKGSKVKKSYLMVVPRSSGKANHEYCKHPDSHAYTCPVQCRLGICPLMRKEVE